jgi:hypothetical protein
VSPRSSLRALLAEERRAVESLAHSRTTLARIVERANIILAVDDGPLCTSAIARELSISRPTVYTWVERFNAQAPDGPLDQPLHDLPVGAYICLNKLD